jgi:predicted membrane channel-forming protein YqfA (hemolysin III family)
MDCTMTNAPNHQPSWRKPAGALLILVLIALWAAGVLLASPWIERLPALAQLPVYVVLGLAWIWVLPLRRLLAWMETGRWG